MSCSSFSTLSDRDLLEHLHQAVERERSETARLVALLMEVDARRLHLALGYSSLFTYCTRVLYLSEHAAFRRIEAARLARRFPVILGLLESGAVTLTTLHLLGRHLTSANHQELLAQVQHRSRHDVEHLLAAMNPREDLASTVTQLAKSPSETTPLAPDRYAVQCTINAAAYEQLRELQNLMRHTVPDGDVGAIFERAIGVLLEQVSRARTGAVEHPREDSSTDGSSRHIAASVRRAVWNRDMARCAYVGTHGRCNEEAGLEIHHVIPFALGGRSVLENLELRCRAHNQYEAEQFFGTLDPDVECVSKPP